MAESNGLLDLMKSPAAMGLLAAGFGGLAGANRNTPYNNLGRAGLAGLAGYSAADALQQKQRDQDKASAIQAAIPTLYGDDGKFDYRRAAELGASPSDIKAYAELPTLGAPQAWKTLEVPGADGSKKIILLDNNGQPMNEGFAGYVAPQLVDTGDKKQFVTPTAGASYQVGMTPAQIDAQNRGWANVSLRGDANRIAGDANNIMAGLKQEEQQLKVDELKAKQDEQRRALGAQQASINAQIGVIDKALGHPGRETVTGLSGKLDPRNYIAGTDATNFKTVVDQIGGAAFLQAFESLKGGGQITEVEGKKATDAMARLNTAQSDAEFKESLNELRQIMAQGQARLGGAPAQQPQAPARTVTRTGVSNGRKVIQYSDGSVEYGD
jgi:hypothetical protein